MKNIFYLIAVVVGLMFARNATATEPKQMTMTLQSKGKVIIDMAGTGTATIDWGGGKARETYTLSAYDNEDWNDDWKKKQPKYRFIHVYPKKSASERTITIIGENISHFDCGSLGLTSLDVSKNFALTDLWCSNNQLTNLDISKNTVLIKLYCSDNQLTNLDVGKNTELVNLSCSENQLTNLDVSKNASLTDLSCFDNQLTSLDISKNTALTNLICSENQLLNLDISKNIALTDLLCSENQLTNLDVSNNSKLRCLDCSDNHLSSLNVSNNPELRGLDCSNNQLSTTAMNVLFVTLHNDSIQVGKRICIFNNQGTDSCSQNIAISLGWTITCPVWCEEDEIFVIMDNLPLFKGKSAEKGFRKYIEHETVYPQIAQKNGIEGMVLVNFVINRQGEVVNARVVQGVHPLLDAESLRVINSSPKWMPGMMRGKPVKVKYTFPFVFRMR